MDTQFLYQLYFVIIVVLNRVTAQYRITPSSSYAVKNREFHLTCNIGPSSSVPTFGIIWRRNGNSVAIVQSSNCQTHVGTDGQEHLQRYTYNCTSNRSYNLYISDTQINSEDGSVWKCEDSDPNLESNSDYTLNVYDPPTADPVISGYSGTTTYLGNTVTLTCTMDGGNPLATLSWTCKSLNVQGVNANTQTSAINRYTVTIDSNYNGQRCTCTASHQLWSDNKQVQSQPFVVHYPPTTNPVVSGYDGTFRYQDDVVALTCTVSGGSPPATLSWTCNGQQQSAMKRSTSGTTVTSNVSVTMKKELNGKTCTCHGRHSDTRYSRNVSSNPFIIYFPPTVQAILEQASITEGQTVYMYCLARGVPDNYTYGGWIQEYRNTMIRYANDLILSENTQNLTLLAVSHQDIGTYRCKAQNSITDKYGVLFQHGVTNLVIKFSAVFNSSRKFHTELNKTNEIRIPFFLNPVLQNVDTITLTKQNISQKERPDIKMNIGTTNLEIVFYGRAVTVEGQEVIIQMIQFKSELQGNYTIGIQNYDEGSASYFEFEVIPSITSNESNVTGTLIGIVVALAVVLVVVGIIGFILLRKRRSSNGTNRKDGVLVNRNSNASPSNDNLEEEEDGILSNILYEPAGANFKKQDTTVGAAKFDETRGNKSGDDNPAALYAEVHKKKQPIDPSAVYAEVQKPNQKQKDGTKPKKGKEKKGDKKDKTTKVSKRHVETGMLYKNVRQDKNGDANMFPSAGEVRGSSTGAFPKGKQSKPKLSEKKNKDGLTYVDLELTSQTSDKKTVIHGSDNRTDYTQVDFSRQAIHLQPRS